MNILLVLSFLGLLNTAHASEIQYNASTSQEIIYAAAVNAGIQYKELNSVIQCESGGNPLALGDHGHSRGLVQISNIYHPDIGDTEAYDPIFSVEYLAKNIAEGNGNLWTCYRIYKSKTPLS